jgi:tetratricopeptide (TPR) repeat protein
MRWPNQPVQIYAPPRSLRRARSFLLKLFGHAFLLLSLGGAIAGIGGAFLGFSPRLADQASAWIRRELVETPVAHFERLDTLSRRTDAAATVAAARRFLDSVTVPHTSDEFSERYRTALRIMARAAEAAGDRESRLEAGARAIAFDSNDSTLLLLYGRALIEARQPDLALTVLESAFQIRPNAAPIFRTLQSLLAETNPGRASAAEQRYHEALALTMVLPTWMTCDLVASGPSASAASRTELSLAGETLAELELEFSPTNIYLVLPKIPELELMIREARVVSPNGASLGLDVQPQAQLEAQPDGFIRITPTSAPDFEQSGVINLALPAAVPPRSRLIVRIQCRPSPPVAAALATFGTWGQAGIKGFSSH